MGLGTYINAQTNVPPSYWSLIHAIDEVVPLVDLHMARYWIPIENSTAGFIAVWAIRVMRLSGWLLTAIFVAGVTGLLRR